MIADEDMIAVTEAINNSTMWHQRLGHMSEKGTHDMILIELHMFSYI